MNKIKTNLRKAISQSPSISKKELKGYNTKRERESRQMGEELVRNLNKNLKQPRKISNAKELARALEKELKKRGISEKIELRQLQPTNEYEVIFKPTKK